MGANVILLDEPSNDLDIETLRALEDAILVFPGTVMVVSHDRWFLDRIATHILSFEGEQPEFFTGNYTEFEEYRRKRDGDDLSNQASQISQNRCCKSNTLTFVNKKPAERAGFFVFTQSCWSCDQPSSIMCKSEKM